MNYRKLFRTMLTAFALLLLMGCQSSLFEKKVRNDVYLEGRNMGGLKKSEVLQRIKERSTKLYIRPIDAQVNRNNWEISYEHTGKKINEGKTLEMLMNSGKGNNIELAVEEVRPKVSHEQLQKNIQVIGSSTTPLLDARDSRLNNIDIASRKINNFKLAPGEEFSFNNTVGKRTKQKGYEEAPIIMKTPDGYKKKNAIGGGICQISTTLYNAVEKAGLEVTERHLHSKAIGYVPKGQDATVSYGSVDFKFRNNRSYPVMIKVTMGGDELTVAILENRNK
ncbi:MAG TPA: VanW family protein [Clostridia bacterium]|nr:VanW family protein [Clostridia bacterium]